MICFRDTTFCTARCATVRCARRWTPELQAKARAWWGKEGAPVAWANFQPKCDVYSRPSGQFDERALQPGEANS